MASPLEFDGGLMMVVVEVKYRTERGEYSTSRHKVRVRSTDNLRKVKKHISESLDTPGTLTYRRKDLNDSKKLSNYDIKEGDKLTLTSERRFRDVKQLTVQLQLPNIMSSGAKMVQEELKIPSTSTIRGLKHKIQDEYGIPEDEHTLHYQQRECKEWTTVLQLLKPVTLEVKWRKKETSCSPVKVAGKKDSIPTGTPYDTKVTSQIKGYEDSSIHPKILKQKRGKLTE